MKRFEDSNEDSKRFIDGILVKRTGLDTIRPSAQPFREIVLHPTTDAFALPCEPLHEWNIYDFEVIYYEKY